MVDVRVFFCCYATDDHVGSDSPWTVDRGGAVELAMRLLRDDGDFFGFVDEQGRVLQFLVEEGLGVRIDLPVPSDRGAYFRYIRQEDLAQELRDVVLPVQVPPAGDYTFEPW